MLGEHLTNFLGSQLAQSSLVQRIARTLAQREERFGLDNDLRRRLAHAWSATQVVKLHGLRNVVRFTGGDNATADGSIQKLTGQEQERRLYELMLDVQGPEGLKDGKWTRYYLSTRASTIGGGTSEIHRNKLAERVLGMPRDPWVDE
jgi:alkylation response protein AidB-like acyl-CoA dehydrogenase